MLNVEHMYLQGQQQQQQRGGARSQQELIYDMFGGGSVADAANVTLDRYHHHQHRRVAPWNHRARGMASNGSGSSIPRSVTSSASLHGGIAYVPQGMTVIPKNSSSLFPGQHGSAGGTAPNHYFNFAFYSIQHVDDMSLMQRMAARFVSFITDSSSSWDRMATHVEIVSMDGASYSIENTGRVRRLKDRYFRNDAYNTFLRGYCQPDQYKRALRFLDEQCGIVDPKTGIADYGLAAKLEQRRMAKILDAQESGKSPHEALADESIGKPFNWTGYYRNFLPVVGRLFPHDARGEAWFCSELVCHAAQLAGILGAKNDKTGEPIIPYYQSPSSLLENLLASGNVQNVVRTDVVTDPSHAINILLEKEKNLSSAPVAAAAAAAAGNSVHGGSGHGSSDPVMAAASPIAEDGARGDVYCDHVDPGSIV